jgi:UDP:flavonoid glycosyltransferase YjiC (YdhE family)
VSRVVASFVGGWGHAEPLLPVARLAASLGHGVTFAGQRAVTPMLAALGFETEVVGPDTLTAERLPLQPVDRAAEQAVLRDHFVARYGQHRFLALADRFQRLEAGLVVCDEVDVGAVAASEHLGIPCVTVSVIAAGRLAGPAVVGTAWNRLRLDHGLDADPEGSKLPGTLGLYPSPRSLRDPRQGWPAPLHAVRPAILERAARGPIPVRPLVYATLGTVFNVESGDLLARLAAALGQIDADALLTVGPNIEPGELGGVARNVHVERFVDQHEVLRRCSAVVTHGGSGTVIAALSLGIPVVVLPLGADQPDNADRCHELGAGIVLDAIGATPVTIAGAVDTVLRDERYAAAAARLAAEASAQPPVHDLTPLRDLLRAS